MRRDISRDANWAKNAQLSSRLISTAKYAPLRFGLFVELRGAMRRDISRDANWAKNAQLSSRLISTAKYAPLRFGHKKTTSYTDWWSSQGF